MGKMGEGRAIWCLLEKWICVEAGFEQEWSEWRSWEGELRMDCRHMQCEREGRDFIRWFSKEPPRGAEQRRHALNCALGKLGRST